MKKLMLLTLFAAFMIGTAVNGEEKVQTNFVIAPPPLGYPEFPDESVFTNKFDFTFASVTGDNLSMNGGALSLTSRMANDFAALDLFVGINTMFGDITYGNKKYDFRMYGMNAAPNLEFPVYDSELFKFIIFGGYDFAFSSGSFKLGKMSVPTSYTATSVNYTTYDVTIYMDTTMYGPFGGLQGSISLDGDLYLSPFVIIKSMSGEMTTRADPNFEMFNTSQDIERFTSITYGFDMMSKSANLSLSGALQSAGKTDSSGGYKIFTISFGLMF